MNEEVTLQLVATAERLANAAEALDWCPGKSSTDSKKR